MGDIIILVHVLFPGCDFNPTQSILFESKKKKHICCVDSEGLTPLEVPVVQKLVVCVWGAQ